MSQTSSFLALGLLVLYVPGVLLLLVCRVRAARVLLGVAPVATLGLLQLATLLATATPLGLPAAAAVVTGLLAAGLLALDLRAGRGGAVVGAVRQAAGAVRRAPVATAVAGGLLLGAVWLATTTWLRGLNGLGTPPQEHDTVTHTMLTALIARTGEASPFDVNPVDYASGEFVRFYPAGLHTYAALLADVAGDAVTGLNAATVLLLAVAGPLTLAAAVATVEPAGARPVYGALAALLAVGLYRPYVLLVHDAGILPFAVGLAMTPALAVCLLASGRRDGPMAVVTAVAALALFTLHPSIAIIAALVTAMVVGTALLLGPGRAWLRARVGTLAGAGLLAAVLVLPWALASVTVAGSVASYPERPPADPLGETARGIAGFLYGGWFDLDSEHLQLGFAVVFWIGVLGCLTQRRLLPLLAAWLGWALAALLYGSGYDDLPGLTQLGSLFFNSWVRIMSVSGVLAPAVAALGTAALVTRVTDRAAARPPARHQQHARAGARTAVPALVAAAVAGVHLLTAGLGYRETNTEAIAERYGDPEFTRISADERAAFAAIAAEPDVGRVLNNANDGSTFLYVYEGIPVVNTYPLGMPEARHGIYLMQHLNDLASDPAVPCLLRRWEVTHVIVSLTSPAIGARGAPDRWVRTRYFDYAPGFFDLTEVPGLEVVHANADAAVFRIDPAVTRDADLDACTADPASPLPGGRDG
ncbi:DUF6541 family protein [Geodermatophilus sp. DSM 44513]|uniref:DUF6541 family protein n=1 Tax=Geodermatophilus sp. DSM 44513 TaxID=1528104 RepID=UPI0012827154|nr:DUF6541 family protein [Geodermatophilus sp. DSM 44513]WNV74795.1 DUF6541 family protein [Geodermatophilus sp. DSM 44513]